MPCVRTCLESFLDPCNGSSRVIQWILKETFNDSIRKPFNGLFGAVRAELAIMQKKETIIENLIENLSTTILAAFQGKTKPV